MANSIKRSGEGQALQVTREARAAGLAEEKGGEDLRGPERWETMADVRVYGFDSVLIVAAQDDDLITMEETAELVASAARDTGSIYEAHRATLRPAGNGCMVSLPGLSETGLSVGDTAPVTAAPGVLFISDGSRDGGRLTRDLESIRQSQLDEGGDGG